MKLNFKFFQESERYFFSCVCVEHVRGWTKSCVFVVPDYIAFLLLILERISESFKLSIFLHKEIWGIHFKHLQNLVIFFNSVLLCTLLPEEYSLTPLDCSNSSNCRLGAEAAQPREGTVTSPVQPELGTDSSLREEQEQVPKPAPERLVPVHRVVSILGQQLKLLNQTQRLPSFRSIPSWCVLFISVFQTPAAGKSSLGCLISHPSMQYFKASVKPEEKNYL